MMKVDVDDNRALSLGSHSDDPLVGEISEIVERNIASIRSIKDVARHVGLSTETIRKTFYRKSGMNLSSFISEVKLAVMKRMLLETDEPCKRICIEVGYREDVGSRLFKNRVGIRMSEYRQLHRQENGL
jgi:AraC-like DNA-binding protein